MNIKNKTLLITGINQFIGLRAAELAIAQGMKVRGLQKDSDREKSQNLDAEVIVGSLTNPAIAQKACQGVDIVLHTAQITQEAWFTEGFSRNQCCRHSQYS